MVEVLKWALGILATAFLAFIVVSAIRVGVTWARKASRDDFRTVFLLITCLLAFGAVGSLGTALWDDVMAHSQPVAVAFMVVAAAAMVMIGWGVKQWVQQKPESLRAFRFILIGSAMLSLLVAAFVHPEMVYQRARWRVLVAQTDLEACGAGSEDGQVCVDYTEDPDGVTEHRRQLATLQAILALRRDERRVAEQRRRHAGAYTPHIAFVVLGITAVAWTAAVRETDFSARSGLGPS